MLSSSAQVTGSGPEFSSVASPAEIAADTEIQQAPALSWTAALVAIWAIGFIVVMGGLLAGLARLVALTRRCRRVTSGAWRERARCCRSSMRCRAALWSRDPDRAPLLTWGLWRPRVIVPAGARSWAAERIDAVLAHEVAHIARRDWALQMPRKRCVLPTGSTR